LIGVGGSTGGVTRERRSSGGAPAGTRAAAKERTGLNHVLHGELPCDLGKMLSGWLGSEDRRRGEFGGPAAAAGARAPAIVRLGLINKQLEEVL
jgi:hypothetical protein